MSTKRLLVFIFSIQVFFVFSILSAATSGKVTGYIYDSQTGSPLAGANAFIRGTAYGTATDINGKFVIMNVPPGAYTLEAQYMGYQGKSVDITVQAGQTLEKVIKLDFQVVEGQAVQITGQAEGQIQAMNQQLSAKTITNVVSEKQIQQLPEANAAEAVGRLPGVSLERSGGEGNKIVIRGMGAKYSLIQIDGVNMAATGQEDRSTDLSMISPYMLEGIELTKSVMANQEATATGGIVNFKIKKAPEKLTYNIIAQGGYNGLRNSYKDFKISSGISNRFYANLFGVYAQVDYEEKDASSQQLGGDQSGGVNFSQENATAPVKTNSMQLKDIFRNVQRIGGALVLDYSLPSTTIKSSNFFSRIKREETSYINNYDFTENDFTLNYEDTPKSWLTVFTNSLQIDHRWRNWEMNSAFSHSYSENELPARISSSNNFSPADPFSTDRTSTFNVNLDPETIPDLLAVSIKDAVYFMQLGAVKHEESKTRERDLSGELNLAYSLNISDQINVKLNVGGKIKHKSKKYDRTEFTATNDGGSQEYRDLVYGAFEDELSDRTKNAWAGDNMYILLQDFMDKDYDGGDFLDGKYDLSYAFDKEKFRRIHDLVLKEFDPTNGSDYQIAFNNFVNSTYFDYHGTEDYHAFYLMPEINLGPKVLFVPGVRYEANRTEYTGYRGNRLGVLRDWAHTQIDTVTKVRENDFFLPMIQTFIRPTDWMTVKAGYTHTLQRPNYNYIMPGWVIGSQGSIDNLSNFRLKPELSRNWDLQVSIHSSKIGLFSVGAFHKKITDMIFWAGKKVILDTAYFELPPIMNRKPAAYAVNNESPAYNYGYELEWQSNFWYLPGLLKGLVVNVNYTRNKSEAKYLLTSVKYTIDPITYKPTYYNEDTTYTAPMIQQPDHLLNLTLGYDIKGFSVRWAMRYKSHIFKNADWYEALRGYSTDFYRYDVQVRQKLPVHGLEFFLNVYNLTGELERDVINHMDFAKYIEDYGRSANVGFRYQF